MNLHFKIPSRISNIKVFSGYYRNIYDIIVVRCNKPLRHRFSGHRGDLSTVYGWLSIFLAAKFVNESGNSVGTYYLFLIKIIGFSTHLIKVKTQVKNVSNGGKIANEANALCNYKDRVARVLSKKNNMGLNFVLLPRHNFSMLNYSLSPNTAKSSERVSLATNGDKLK